MKANESILKRVLELQGRVAERAEITVESLAHVRAREGRLNTLPKRFICKLSASHASARIVDGTPTRELATVKAWIAGGCEGPQPRPDAEVRRVLTDRLMTAIEAWEREPSANLQKDVLRDTAGNSVHTRGIA